MPRGAGYSFLEMVLALAIAGLLLGIAAPPLLRTSDRVALADARWRVSSAVSSARGAAVRWGRVSALVVDAAAASLMVEVDTTVLGGGPPVPLIRVELGADLGIGVSSNLPRLCFDPRGLAVPASGCADRTVVVHLSRGAAVDSVTVSPTGRVIR